MKVKLLNASLIRTLGGVIVEMTDSQAEKYISRGDAMVYRKSINASPFDKSTKRPPENKMVWSPPEQKLFEFKEEDKEEKESRIFPGPNDKLFSQIKLAEV